MVPVKPSYSVTSHVMDLLDESSCLNSGFLSASKYDLKNKVVRFVNGKQWEVSS